MINAIKDKQLKDNFLLDFEKTNRLRQGDFELLPYDAAVRQLYDVARHNTSGGRAAANLLLSVMNSGRFSMDMSDFNVLDQDNFIAAVSVIFWRYVLSVCPSEFLPDGYFQTLFDNWCDVLPMSKQEQQEQQ